MADQLIVHVNIDKARYHSAYNHILVLYILYNSNHSLTSTTFHLRKYPKYLLWSPIIDYRKNKIFFCKDRMTLRCFTCLIRTLLNVNYTRNIKSQPKNFQIWKSCVHFLEKFSGHMHFICKYVETGFVWLSIVFLVFLTG